MDKSSSASIGHNLQAPERLLYTRKQACELLGGISRFTLLRLEAENRLRPVRLTRSPTSQVYYTREDLLGLVGLLVAENADRT